jgi:hypothetical protein
MPDDQENRHDTNQPLSSILKEKVIGREGEEIVVSTEAYVKKDTGTWVKQTKENYRMAADGRWIRVDQFIATSWTGLEVPKDRTSCCLDPFERHDERLVYLKLDGYETKLGNVLCTECREHQKKRLFWKYVLFFGLIYDPEEF